MKDIKFKDLKVDKSEYFIDNKEKLHIRLPKIAATLHCMVCDEPAFTIDGLLEFDEENIQMAIPNSLLVCGNCYQIMGEEEDVD